MKKSIIPGYDRFQALLRIPQFKNDLETIQKQSNLKKREILKAEFVKKYNLTFQLAEHLLKGTSLFLETRESMDDIFYGTPVEVIPAWHEVETIPYKHLKSDMYDLRDGKYLILKIDLTKSKNKIIKKVKSDINLFRKYVTAKIPKKKYLTKHQFDNTMNWTIWKIFDHCNQPGFKNPKGKIKYAKVIKSLYGDNVSYDSERHNIKRAYIKAESIINTINKELKKRTSLRDTL
jgi:hypothetical protein